MSRNMCAVVRMEERYLRLTIEYNNQESKKQIDDVVSKIEKETNLFPSVTRRSIGADAGNYSIEFDAGSGDREAGDFFEKVIKELNITQCD